MILIKTQTLVLWTTIAFAWDAINNWIHPDNSEKVKVVQEHRAAGDHIQASKEAAYDAGSKAGEAVKEASHAIKDKASAYYHDTAEYK